MSFAICDDARLLAEIEDLDAIFSRVDAGLCRSYRGPRNENG